MSRTQRTSITWALALALSAVQGLACGSGPKKSGVAPVSLIAVPRVVSGVFLDAATQRPIAGKLEVTVLDPSGALAAVAVDQVGNPMSHFTVQDGVATFRISPAVQLPQSVTVIGKVAGYDSGSAAVSVTSEAGARFKVSLVNLAAPPAGVSAVGVPIGDATTAGVLTAGATVTTPVEPHTGGEVQIAIPPGTTLTTSAGVPLSGALMAGVTFFDNRDASSLAAYPGGFGSAPPLSLGGPPGVFLSGGFGAVEISDLSGHVAGRYSAPITVNLTVPFTTVNPVTGKPVQPGDVIPLWTFDDATGLWSSAGNVTLGPGTLGTNYVATAQITQGNYFNVDWDVARCTSPAVISVTGSFAQPLTIDVQSTGNGYFETADLYSGTSTFAVSDAPANVPAIVTAWYGGQQVGSLSVSNLCGGAFVLPVSLPTFQMSNLEVTAYEVCVEDPSQQAPLPSATALVAPAAGGTPLLQTTDAAGATRFTQLLAGTPYTVSVTSLLANADLSETTVVQALTPVAGDNAVTVKVPVTCTPYTVTGTGGAGF